MIAYHSTSRANVDSILKEGLRPNGIGIVYLSPSLGKARKWCGQVIFEVETGDLRLTAFDDCKKWEILCWGRIPPQNLRVVENN